MPYGVDYGYSEQRLAIAIADQLSLRGVGSPSSSSSGSTSIVPLRAAVNASASGDNTIVTSVASKKVKLLGAILVAAGDVNLTIKSSSGTSLSGSIPMAAKGNGFVLPVAPLGYHLIETIAGDGLIFTLSADVAVTGAIAYLQEA